MPSLIRISIWLIACATLARADPRSHEHLSQDDIRSRLIESDRLHDCLLRKERDEPIIGDWRCMTDLLRSSTGLDLGMAYTVLGQSADSVIRGPHHAISGDFDLFGRWSLRPDEQPWPFAINIETEWRHAFSRVAPAGLQTGILGDTVVDFNEQSFSLIQLYLEAGSADDQWVIRFGKLDPADHYDVGRYVTPDEAFLSPAFSDNLPMALPNNGLGMVLTHYPHPNFYLEAGIHDANAQRTGGVSDVFDDPSFFTAFEAGWNPGHGSSSEGLYHATVWHTESRPKAKKASDWGFAIHLEQECGPSGDFVPFLRYSWADQGLNDVKQNLSVGIGFENLFGQTDDAFAIAASWMEPINGKLRDQYVIEAFYRIYLTPHFHVTPDIQFVFDPSNAPKKDMVTVAGLRLRTVF